MGPSPAVADETPPLLPSVAAEGAVAADEIAADEIFPCYYS
jgi:hypothetical protein